MQTVLDYRELMNSFNLSAISVSPASIRLWMRVAQVTGLLRSSSPSNHSVSICRQASSGCSCGASISMLSILGPSKSRDLAKSFHPSPTPSMTFTFLPPQPFSTCSSESLGLWSAEKLTLMSSEPPVCFLTTISDP